MKNPRRVSDAHEKNQSLRNRVVQSLEATGYLDFRQIECRIDDGVVHLTGVVPSFHLKQLAQAAIIKLSEVRAVQNDLRVKQ